jgi:hypothetical protein
MEAGNCMLLCIPVDHKVKGHPALLRDGPFFQKKYNIPLFIGTL